MLRKQARQQNLSLIAIDATEEGTRFSQDISQLAELRRDQSGGRSISSHHGASPRKPSIAKMQMTRQPLNWQDSFDEQSF